MPTFNVTIATEISTVIEVEAEDEDEAKELAFDEDIPAIPWIEGWEESGEQEVVNVEAV